MKIIKIKTTKADEAVDENVIASADNVLAWEKEIAVNPHSTPTSIRLSTKTIQKAKFFARVHHERGYQSWIKKIVEERIDTEYQLYKRLKKEAIA